MHHRNTALGAEMDLGPGQLGHVHGDQPIVDQAQTVQAGDRALAVLFLRLRDFLRGLVKVQVHGQVQLVGQHADVFEIGIRHRVGSVRRERSGDEGVIAPLVVNG